MELAGCIQGLLVRESRQPIGLAALLLLGGRLPFWLLILDRRHLPASGSRLGGLPLVITWLLSPTGVTSRSPRCLRRHLAGRVYQDFRLHGGVVHGVLVGDDQQLIKGLGLVAEEAMLEEGALSAPGSEVLDCLHLVHAFAGVA